jgi:hypothetical protein
MSFKKINDSSTPILKSSQSNTDSIAGNDINTRKRKADVLFNNDESGLSFLLFHQPRALVMLVLLKAMIVAVLLLVVEVVIVVVIPRLIEPMRW